MSASCSKKKEKVDLSKLSAMELLLIGESQTLGSQPCSSKSIKFGSHDSSGYDEGEDDDERDVGTMMDSDDEDEEEDDNSRNNSESGSEESDDDFEEVSDRHVEAELHKYEKMNGESSSADQLSQIPDGGLEIVIPREGVFRKKKKDNTIEDLLRKAMNRDRLELQEYLHKTSVLCQLARGLQLNKAINSKLLHDAIKERLKGQTFSPKRLDIASLERFIKWFRFNVILTKPSITGNLEISVKDLRDEECLVYQIMEKTALDGNWNVLIFAAFLRYLKIDTRLVLNVAPIPLRPPSGELIRKPKEEGDDDDDSQQPGCSQKSNNSKGRKSNKESDKLKSKTQNSPGKKKSKGKKVEKDSEKKKGPGKNSGRKMVSSEDEDYEDDKPNKKKGGKIEKKSIEAMRLGQDLWTEVYLIEEERWVSVDILQGKVICDKQLGIEATNPLSYILAFNIKNKIKDVTRRYASEWLMGTQKLRVKSDWWDETLKPYRGKRTARDKEEDEFLDQHLMSLPIPRSVSEIKGHPLFVLRRHLLKYEGLYPENPPTVAFIKGEAVYSRDNVHTLHTRELWMREAKVVRIGEQPYKIVKARPKYDKLTGSRLPDTTSELFGPWQTEDFIPPIAQDGKVPRNEWGNVELFTQKLLPQGCVHLRLPGLQRVAKKLDIDCAPAVVGFDFGCGGSRPAFDGFVVCEEFEETLVDAWNEDQEEKKKKDEEKRLQRIYGNWRKLVRGVMIRARLEKKYSINLSGKRKSEPEPATPTASSSKRSRRK